MDWPAIKDEEESVTDMGLDDLSAFDFSQVLGEDDGSLLLQGGFDNADLPDLMSAGTHISHLQQQHIEQQRHLHSQMAHIEEALAAHPFFRSHSVAQQPPQFQPHFNPSTQVAASMHLGPSPTLSGSSSATLYPLPEIQISEFPEARARGSSSPASTSPFFGSFSSSPTSISPLSQSGDQPTILTRLRSSPTGSGRTSPLSLSSHALPAINVTMASGPFVPSSGAGPMSTPIATPPAALSGSGGSLSSSSSSGKRKKPLKKKQASLPQLLPSPTAPTLSSSPTSLSTSPSFSSCSASSSSSPFISVLSLSTTSTNHLYTPGSAPPAGMASLASFTSSPTTSSSSSPIHSSPPTSPLGPTGGWTTDVKPTNFSVQSPKILKIHYDEVIFSAAKTPTKVSVVCTPTALRPLGVECIITRPNMPQPVVVPPTQITVHDDTNDQRATATCTIVECHFPFPTVMKTHIGGVKVANVQFRLFHTPAPPSPPILLDCFYKDGDKRSLPMVAYPHTKAKIQCWAIVIWYADRGPEYEQLTWAELAKRFAYFYTRHLNEPMHPQSIRFLGEKLGIPNAGKESSKDEIVTFETYMQTRVGHWLYNAVQAIKSYYDLWRNYSLRMFLTHKDAVVVLKQMNAKPGDFLFRIPSQLAEEDTRAFKTRSPSSTLVFTYVQQVGDEIRFSKVDISDKVREDPKFVHEKKELMNVLCLNEKGEMVFRHKLDCCFNEKQKKKESGFKSAVKLNDDGDEYQNY